MAKTMRPSMRAAVNAKCRDCIYDPLSGLGTWRAQVALCGSLACPLHPVRPLPSCGPLSRQKGLKGPSVDPGTAQ